MPENSFHILYNRLHSFTIINPSAGTIAPSGMETQLHHDSEAGNWVAFLFGAMFNILANFDIPAMIDYAMQAFTGGFICLLFKLLGDYLSPVFRSWWEDLQRWIEAGSEDDDEDQLRNNGMFN